MPLALHHRGRLHWASWLLTALVCLPGCFDPDHGADLDLSSGGGSSEGGSSSEGGGSTGADVSTGQEAESGEAGESSGGGIEAACQEYCSLVTDHCADDLSQYSGTQLCESTCAFIPLGQAGDELGNSVACRSFHAVLAAEGPEVHCPHAGPAGDGTCGADCESFCSLAASTCGDLNPFAGAEACIAACEGFPTDPQYSAEAPDADSYACRLRHLTLAGLQPEIHCPHIDADSPVCFDS